VMAKSFQFGLDKIADAFQERAQKLFNKEWNLLQQIINLDNFIYYI
jgi:hypothetical protein